MGDTGSVVVIANPTAGRGKAGKLIGKVDEILRSLGVEHSVKVSESAADMERLAREAGGSGAEIVAALGGDGSVGLVANGLLGTGAALAVLPGGTADDFAKSVMGTGKLEEAARMLAVPDIRSIDVVRVTAGAQVRHYVAVAGAGFDSEVNETANAMKIGLGSTGTYVAAVLKTLKRFVPARYEFTVDGQEFELEAMLAVVGNSQQYGGGMRVCPQASVVDGLMDLVIVEALSRGAFLRAFPRVFKGSHLSHPKVRMMNAKSVKIEANRKIQVYADGERVGSLPAIFEVLPGALPAVVGKEARAIR